MAGRLAGPGSSRCRHWFAHEVPGWRVRTFQRPKISWFVVYSHKLNKSDLRAGEQFVVEANIVAKTGGRARFSTQLILAKNPNATSGSLDKIAPGQISEHNGKNCTGGLCQTRKVSVFRVTDDIAGPVYVNVVVKSAVPGGGSTNVVVDRNGGWVRSTRYRSALNARN